MTAPIPHPSTRRSVHRRLHVRSMLVTCAAAFAALASCAEPPTALLPPARVETSSGAATSNGFPRYEVVDLGTLGGFFSGGVGINEAGDVGGGANDATELQHAVIWPRGEIDPIDLGWPGGNAFAIGPNNRGQVSALTETSEPDPNNEDLCGFGTHRICVASVWQRGVWTRLPSLGGLNAEAANLNDRGEVAGAAETPVVDPSCAEGTPFQLHQFQPVLWMSQGSGFEVRRLPVLPGDQVGFAFDDNDRGQVVGSTGACATTFVAGAARLAGPHAVLWDSDGQRTAIPLDPPGSTDALSTAYGINNRGQIAGASGTTSLRSWVWSSRTGRIWLGTLPGDLGSVPQWINNRGQVVGASCVDTPLCVLGPGVQLRAYLWQDGVMADLNDLIASDSHLYLGVALAINDRGQITGIGVTNEGEPHAFLATPVHGQ